MCVFVFRLLYVQVVPVDHFPLPSSGQGAHTPGKEEDGCVWHWNISFFCFFYDFARGLSMSDKHKALKF